MDLKSILSASYTGFEHRLHKMEYSCPNLSGHNVTANFMYLPFIKSNPSDQEFVQAIYERIVPFCLPNHVIEKQEELFRKDPKNTYLISQLQEKAKGLFQKAKGTRKTAGEVGELILFVLQEHVLMAPQIACKMNLKTNTEMPVHGSDGIHVLKKENGDICFLWGESKIYQNPKKAVDKLVDSIISFNKIDAQTGKKPKDRDIEILNDYPSISNKTIEEKLLKFFNPYEPEYNQRLEGYSCFIGFDFEEFESLKNLGSDVVVGAFHNKYQDVITEITKAFSDKIKASSIASEEFYFFLVPFTSVKNLRKSFFEKLGIFDVDTEDED